LPDFKTITLEINGFTRNINLQRNDKGNYIPHPPLYTDIELINVTAATIAGKISNSEWDIIAGIAERNLSLMHVISTFCGRRECTAFLRSNPFGDSYTSVGNNKRWYAPKEQIENLTGKKVLLVTDVAEKAGPLDDISLAISNAGGQIALRAAILVTENAANSEDYVFVKEFKV